MVNWRDKRRFRIKRRFLSSDTKSINKSRLLMRLAKIVFLGVLGVILLSFIAFPLIAYNLPSPEKVIRREGFATKILDKNGESLYDIYSDEKRIPVEVDDIPDYLKKATISIEDKDFYKHQGFDVKGILRGFLRFFTTGRAQGGSTLTQQLVKNVLLTSERSITRKVKELILAVQIERKYSKDQILQMYLNEAPYGGNIWGVAGASETYFGKRVKDLNLVESAILAGIPQRPSYYSPYSAYPTAYKDRTIQVLRRMREDGYITEDQEKNAKDELDKTEVQAKGSEFRAPHFVQYVQRILEDRYGENVVEQGGLKVTTTLDLDLQESAQKIVKEEIDKVNERYHITNGASVVLNPETGEILAMVGSKDFLAEDYDGQYNVVTALRQPGSAIKPITYVTALKKGYTASSLLMDVQTEFRGGAGQPPYAPLNYDGKYKGPVQVRFALANSINIPAVKMLANVGIKDTLQMAYDLGITTLPPTQDTLDRVGLSLTLGGGEVRLLELTDAYGAFLNKGFRIDPVAILKVEDKNGKVLEDVKPQKGRSVLTPEEAYLIADILSDNEARSLVFGLNSLLNVPGRQVAVKTGTTNDKRDNWTIGGTSQALVGVWVGNNDNSPMLQVASGVSGASPIWRKILLESLKDKPAVSFEVPGGIVTKAVDSVSGYNAHDGYPSRIEKFIVGTEPDNYDPVHAKLKVCKTDGKLATPGDVASGNYDEMEFFVFKEEDPTAPSGEANKFQEGIMAWLATQSDSKYHPPSDYCGSGSPVGVSFVSPTDHTSNLPNKFNVEIRADSTSDISLIELYIDDVRLRSFVAPPYKDDINLSDGVHKIKVKARDANGKESERTITVGVNIAWDFVTPTPSPTVTPTQTPTPILTIVPTE